MSQNRTTNLHSSELTLTQDLEHELVIYIKDPIRNVNVLLTMLIHSAGLKINMGTQQIRRGLIEDNTMSHNIGVK
jgi:hypothetical protein